MFSALAVTTSLLAWFHIVIEVPRSRGVRKEKSVIFLNIPAIRIRTLYEMIL